MDNPFLSLEIHKQFQNFLLEIKLDLRTGITALFGPSGAGKSTTLNSIAGFSSPDKGEIVLNGRTLFRFTQQRSSYRIDLPPEQRRIGYLLQNALLFPHLNVLQNLLYGYRRTPNIRKRIHIESLIEILELAPLLHQRPSTLSGGEAQRVALARALATSPDLLMLDEPLASMDSRLRGRTMRYLKNLHQELGIPMLYVSHSLSEILALANHVVAISNGRIVAEGKPYSMLHQLPKEASAELTDLENLLEAEVVANWPENGLTQTRVGNKTLWVSYMNRPAKTSISIAIRAADILVALVKPQELSARNILPANLLAVDSSGHKVILTLDVGFPLLAEVTPDARDSLSLTPGKNVHVIIKSSSISLLE
jgi:molybdate transport system ATP-binding protein